MYSRLAVALDGSPLAERALPVAIRLAKLLEAQLVLLRTIGWPKDSPEAEQRNREDGISPEAYFERLKKDLTDPAKPLFLPPERVTVSLHYEKLAYQLGEVAAAEGDDLLIMTTHGRSGLSLLVMGSIAAGVLRHSSRPLVLLTPAATGTNWQEDLAAMATELSQATPKQAQLLVTLDGSPRAEAALESAISLATQLKTSLHLVESINPIPPLLLADPIPDVNSILLLEEAQEEVLHDQAAHYLRQVKEWLKTRQPELEVETTILEGQTVSQLEVFVENLNPLLVVMATHARSEVSQVLLGSVAEEVLRRTHLPILMVPIPKGFAGVPELQARQKAESSVR